MNKVLLIAYKFPPYGGVGGFRWSKLAKYLASQGNEVHVLAYDWPEGAPNSLSNDVRHENIKIVRIPSLYPHRLRSLELRGKFLRRIRRLFVQLIDRTVFFDDEAQYWGRHLLPAADALIKQERIGVVVATGHPFQANYWASVLKAQHPALRLVQDLRDPWLSPERYGGGGWRYASIRRRMLRSINAADVVITVTEGLRDAYQRVCPAADVRVIYNGFDPDIVKLSSTPEATRPHTVLSHIGNISNNRDLICDRLFSAVQELNDTHPLKLRFAGSLPASARVKYRSLFDSGVIDYLGVLPQDEALRVVAESDFALQFNADISPVPLSTKIYEYAALRVPVISLNYGGEIAGLIERHSLGHSINVGKEDVARRLESILSVSADFSFDVENFSYDVLARQYAQILWPDNRAGETDHGGEQQ